MSTLAGCNEPDANALVAAARAGGWWTVCEMICHGSWERTDRAQQQAVLEALAPWLPCRAAVDGTAVERGGRAGLESARVLELAVRAGLSSCAAVLMQTDA